MKQIFWLLFVGCFLGLNFFPAYAYAPFGRQLCKSPGYICQKIPKRQSWETLFPNDTQRLLVMQLNRMNTPLYTGMVIAVPQNITRVTLMNFSPFPAQIQASGAKEIFVDPTVLAWGAYDPSGKLVRWGPASLGSNYCPDLGHRCHSPVGAFAVYQKGTIHCRSSKFPLPRGGAPMPYCMYFHRGFALHGEPGGLPGDNVSHGCVRLFVSDAEWLSESFVDFGTHVTIRPYGDFSRPQRSSVGN